MRPIKQVSLDTAILLSALAILGAPARAQSVAAAGYPPHRVYETSKNRLGDLEGMLARLATFDAVFLGEQHDDPRTHQLELAVLEGIARRRSGRIVLALEMFERDVQPALDAYLAGTLGEEEFLAAARPWPNYASDYRPLIEFARTRGWPVVAGNVPRRLASTVSRRGLAALDSLDAGERAFAAQEHQCPRDAYWERFRATMGDLSGHGPPRPPEELEASVWRMYEAQCVKDEAMGEAVAAALAAPGTLVIHVNGSFHSDHRQGALARVKRRLSRARVAVVSFVPVEDLDRVELKPRRRLADYVVFTLAPPKAAPSPRP